MLKKPIKIGAVLFPIVFAFALGFVGTERAKADLDPCCYYQCGPGCTNARGFWYKNVELCAPAFDPPYLYCNIACNCS